jgi:putative transposase
VKGRKRHLIVDVLGLVMSCGVSAANIADVDVKAAALVLVLALENNPRLVKSLADQSYRSAAIALLLQQDRSGSSSSALNAIHKMSLTASRDLKM